MNSVSETVMGDYLEFAKLSGSGNDFICIDNRNGRWDDIIGAPGRVARFAKVLCHRGIGAGADGVIFACTPEIEGVAAIGARFFEADGSEAELCGNGAGCFVHWVIESGMVPAGEVKILTPAGVVRGQNSTGRYVRVCIPSPENIQTNQQLSVAGKSVAYDFAVTGVPHVVHYVDDIDAADVAGLGCRMRHHERFKPRGANINFVQVLGAGRLAVRTYEFGVEGETLACGTGSAAAAILSAMRFGWGCKYKCGSEPVKILARSGDTLKIYFTIHDDGSVTDVCLETVVRYIYRGVLQQQLAAAALDEAAEI